MPQVPHDVHAVPERRALAAPARARPARPLPRHERQGPAVRPGARHRPLQGRRQRARPRLPAYDPALRVPSTLRHAAPRIRRLVARERHRRRAVRDRARRRAVPQPAGRKTARRGPAPGQHLAQHDRSGTLPSAALGRGGRGHLPFARLDRPRPRRMGRTVQARRPRAVGSASTRGRSRAAKRAGPRSIARPPGDAARRAHAQAAAGAIGRTGRERQARAAQRGGRARGPARA